MRLGTRAAIALGALAAITVGLGVYNLTSLKQADDSDTMMYERATKPLAAVGTFRAAILRGWADLAQGLVVQERQTLPCRAR